MTTSVPELNADEAAQIAADILGTTPEGGEEQAVDSLEETQAADDVAAESVEEPEAATEELESKEAGEGSKGTTKDSLDKYIDSKYGGDREKFVNGLYELMNTGSKQHKEIQQLLTTVEELKSALVKPQEETPETSPDVALLEQRGARLEDQVKSIQKRMQGIVDKVDRTRLEIAEKQGELKVADEFDKSVKAQELRALKETLENLKDTWDEQREKLEGLNYEKLELKNRLDKALEDAKATSFAKRQQQVEDVNYQKDFIERFNKAVGDKVTERGFAADSRTGKMILKLAKAEAREYLAENPGMAIDPEEFVTEKADDLFSALEEVKQAQLGKLTKDKLAATTKTPEGKTPVTTKPANAPAPKKSSGKLSYEQAIRHAAKVLDSL